MRVDMRSMAKAGVDMSMPRTFAECMDDDEPCAFVSCRHHLYLEVDESNGCIKINFPGVEVWEMAETCSLKVARDNPDGLLLGEVGDRLNVVQERVRQIEEGAQEKVRSALRRRRH